MSEFSGKVQTVLGPIDPSNLGPTLTHEHLLVDGLGDAPSPGRSATDRAKWLEPITLENVYDIRREILFNRSNMQLTNIDEAIEEATRYRAAGGNCIVDLTCGGLSRDPEGLVRISRLSQVHIVMGAGYYVRAAHPEHVASMSKAEVRDEIVRDITQGSPGSGMQTGRHQVVGQADEGSGIRSGIIGEIGLSWPVDDEERKVLAAAVEAQLATGVPLSIHPGRDTDAPLHAARIVEEEGGDLGRTVICHLDRTLFSLDDMLELAQTGVYLEFDLFGMESFYYPLSPIDIPNDATRVDYLIALSEHGHADQLLISHDIDAKTRTRKYGGEGRDHILLRVVPLMRRKGMSQKDIDRVLIGNPASLLTIA